MSRSLRSRLTTLTLACIGLVMLPLLLASYLKVVEEVNELSDARLAQAAKTLEAISTYFGDIPTSQSPIEIASWVRPKGAQEAMPQGHGYETEVGFQYWQTSTRLRLTTQDLADLAFDAAPIGFADIVKGKRHWRIYTKIGENGGFVRAAERYDSRQEIVRDLLIQNAAPLVLGLPLLAFLMGWAVRRGLQPLAETTARIEARSPEDIGPMDVHDAPAEIAPLIGALNGLLQRVRRLLDHERQFTENAAHELRTPLAGALIQLDNAAASDSDVERAIAHGEARAALDRMTRLVNQMLELARWDSASSTQAFSDVELAHCVDAELESLALRAVARNIEIVRFVDPRARRVHGWEAGLRVLIRNLLDNALKYAAAGGRIAIHIASDANSTGLAICDDGPGIDPVLRDDLFDRFQRGGVADVEGAGLGLSIARRIAELHGASLELTDPPAGSGLCVKLRFPDRA